MCWKVSMPSIPKVETTARELVPQTESKAPDSPIFGDSNDSFLNIVKKRGTQALKIDARNTDKQSSGYSPINY